MFSIFIISCALVAGGIIGTRLFALRLGFVDTPNDRKTHDIPVPPIGGLVVFPVFIGLHILFGADITRYWSLYAGLIMLLGMGAWDDYKYCPPYPKFTAQILSATIIVVLGGVKITHLGNIFGLGPLDLNTLSIPFTITAIVLFINAVNLMDGLDGLAGGYGLIVCIFLLMVAVLNGHAPLIMPLVILAGVMSGFLIHNIRSPVTLRARVFLGDSGSLSLGLIIAWFAITAAQVDTGEMLRPIIVAWALALPIMDTCAQFYRRARAGRSPFSPDRGHFHHQLTDAGLSVSRAVWMILGVMAALMFGAYFAVHCGVPDWILTVLWTGTLITHIVLSRKIGLYTLMIQRFSKNAP